MADTPVNGKINMYPQLENGTQLRLHKINIVFAEICAAK